MNLLEEKLAKDLIVKTFMLFQSYIEEGKTEKKHLIGRVLCDFQENELLLLETFFKEAVMLQPKKKEIKSKFIETLNTFKSV